MTLAIAHELFTGFSKGNIYANMKTKEDEVLQGENYYFAAFTQVGQFYVTSQVVGKVVETFFKPLKGMAVLSFIPFVTSILTLPVSLVMAAIKHDDYGSFARYCNAHQVLPFRLPDTVSATAHKVVDFFANHSGDILRVAITVSAVALIALGQTFYGGAMLAMLTYQFVDQMGWVPRQVSLFVETYIPAIALVGFAIDGSIFDKIISTISLPLILFPQASQFLQRKIDLLARYYFNIDGPNLQDIEAPLVVKKDLSYTEINEILDGHEHQYEMNPAHLSKWACDLSKLKVDDRFEKLTALFDAVNWEEKYNLLKRGLKEDEHFIKHLQKSFPGHALSHYSDNFDGYIPRLAQAKGITTEKYAATWLREQLVELVRMLKGEKRPKGLQQDLQDAITNLSKVLPYLESLTSNEERVEKEDCLFKIALEAGDYCARGIKRASNELLGNILQKASRNDENIDAIADYEGKIRQDLQDRRYQIMLASYQKLLQAIRMGLPQAVSRDTHSFDLYRLHLSLGFFPLTDYERSQVGIVELAVWETYAFLRREMFSQYNPYDLIEARGNLHFANYLRSVIEANPRLQPSEKEAIIEKFSERNQNRWSEDLTHQNFYRLVCVMLGIKRKM